MTELSSKDLFRVAYLLCEGAILREARLVESQRVTFIIKGEGLLQADSRYRTGQALINPIQLRESLNLLRDLIRKTQNPKIERKTYGKKHNRSDKTGGGSC